MRARAKWFALICCRKPASQRDHPSTAGELETRDGFVLDVLWIVIIGNSLGVCIGHCIVVVGKALSIARWLRCQWWVVGGGFVKLGGMRDGLLPHNIIIEKKSSRDQAPGLSTLGKSLFYGRGVEHGISLGSKSSARNVSDNGLSWLVTAPQQLPTSERQHSPLVGKIMSSNESSLC